MTITAETAERSFPTAATPTDMSRTQTATPFRGVVVSDGFTCTQTDAEGQYVLTRNAESGFVFYSLPSGYKVNMHKTYKLPKFFTKLKPETARYDFTLTALDAPETRFDLICIGDPPDQRGGARRPVQARSGQGHPGSIPPRPTSRATPSTSATW